VAAFLERNAIPLRAALCHRVTRMMHGRADAENLLQDTMMSAYVRFGSFGTAQTSTPGSTGS
jgi:DNA-directed RNA polymerase specialized sigma24 family protein